MGWERVVACGCRYVRRSDGTNVTRWERWERVLTCRECALAEARLTLAGGRMG